MRDVPAQLANDLRDEGVIDERESFIDATFAFAKGGRRSGPTQCGKGVTQMAKCRGEACNPTLECSAGISLLC